MEMGEAPVEAEYASYASWKKARNAWDSQRRALRGSEAKRQKADAAALQAAANLEAATQWYGSEAARLAINTKHSDHSDQNRCKLPDGSMFYPTPYRPPVAAPLRTQPYRRCGRPPSKQPLEAVALGPGERSKSGCPTELRLLARSPGGTRYPSIVYRHALPMMESEDSNEVWWRRRLNSAAEARALKRLRRFKASVDAATAQLTGRPACSFLRMAKQGLFVFFDEHEASGENPMTVRVQTAMLVLAAEYLAVLKERHEAALPCKLAARQPAQSNERGLVSSLPQPFPMLSAGQHIQDQICEPTAALITSRAAVIHFVTSNTKVSTVLLLPENCTCSSARHIPFGRRLLSR